MHPLVPNSTEPNWKYRDKKSWCWLPKIDNLITLISDCEWKLMFGWVVRANEGCLCVCVCARVSLECRASVSILNEQLSVPPLIPVSSGKMMVTHNLNKPGYCNTATNQMSSSRTEGSRRLSLRLKVLKLLLLPCCVIHIHIRRQRKRHRLHQFASELCLFVKRTHTISIGNIWNKMVIIIPPSNLAESYTFGVEQRKKSFLCKLNYYVPVCTIYKPNLFYTHPKKHTAISFANCLWNSWLNVMLSLVQFFVGKVWNRPCQNIGTNSASKRKAKYFNLIRWERKEKQKEDRKREKKR